MLGLARSSILHPWCRGHTDKNVAVRTLELPPDQFFGSLNVLAAMLAAEFEWVHNLSFHNDMRNLPTKRITLFSHFHDPFEGAIPHVEIECNPLRR